MQRLTADSMHVRIVKIVPDKGETDMFHMYADLVGTAGLEAKRD